MKTIELTQGKVALVDDEDFENLNQYKWRAHKVGNVFYAEGNTRRIKLQRTKIRMHREITNAPKGMDVDHIDGDGLNNCRSNLRAITHRQNLQNQHVKKSSAFPGVCWHKAIGKWQAQIRINGKKKYLGLFNIEAEAYNAYLKALENIGEICVNDIVKEGEIDAA